MDVSGDDHEPKMTRVGNAYQAEVPPFVSASRPRRGAGAKTVPDSGCYLVWRPKNQLMDLDSFLRRASSHMEEPHTLDTERTHFALLQNKYDIKRTLASFEPKTPMAPKTDSAPSRSRRAASSASKPSTAPKSPPNSDVGYCFACKHGGTVMLCDAPSCERLFHPECVGLERVPAGNFFSARHVCALCGSTSDPKNQCHLCPVAYVMIWVWLFWFGAGFSCWLCGVFRYCSQHPPLGCQSVTSSAEGFTCINCAKQHSARQPFFKSLSEFHSYPKGLPNYAIEGRPVDLWAFYHSVITLGGYDAVSRSCLFLH